MDLTGKQKRYLRGLGHPLTPVVALGKEGFTDAVVKKTALELDRHELIKVRIGDGCLDPVEDVGPRLAKACSAALVQIIGHTALLYRRRPDEPGIVLPK